MSPATFTQSGRWVAMSRRLMWPPDVLPSLRRSLHEFRRVLEAPLPDAVESEIVGLQEEFGRLDQSLNEKAMAHLALTDILCGDRRRPR